MKRVFTKTFRKLQVPGLVATEPLIFDGVKQFLAEEDIWIVGVQLRVLPTRLEKADGEAFTIAQVSQSAKWGQGEGVLIEAGCYSNWEKLVTAQDIGNVCGENAVVMFPEGYGIPIKEEGSVWLNIESVSYMATNAVESHEVLANIYYTKGK